MGTGDKVISKYFSPSRYSSPPQSYLLSLFPHSVKFKTKNKLVRAKIEHNQPDGFRVSLNCANFQNSLEQLKTRKGKL